MTDQHATGELFIFKAFVPYCPQLKIKSDSIQKRQPPAPDIWCKTINGEDKAFELVELVDSEIARSTYQTINFEKFLFESQKKLSKELQEDLMRRLGGALVAISFREAINAAAKRKV